MAIDLPASEAERAARGLIEQASTALAKRRRDIPATFIAQLYARSVPEDMVRYGAERYRRPGRAGLRFYCRARAGQAENPLRDCPALCFRQS